MSSIPGGTTRARNSGVVTIAADQSLSDVIDMRGFGGGSIILPADWTNADIGAAISVARDGNYAIYADHENLFGTDVSIDAPEGGRAYPMPAWWFGAHFLRLFSHNGSGTPVNQIEARQIQYMLKA